eukprot:TRINITY_DN1699_c0_g1_i12.p1 TRINITY_DN1699_c0_g1~~TRINITY_DN1699_c0_g1_i12.p1  ORF type:complete len:1784 (+),score=480.39 TRINITY_DN1699_c0_g1_i12:3709-9060(+)
MLKLLLVCLSALIAFSSGFQTDLNEGPVQSGTETIPCDLIDNNVCVVTTHVTKTPVAYDFTLKIDNQNLPHIRLDHASIACISQTTGGDGLCEIKIIADGTVELRSAMLKASAIHIKAKKVLSDPFTSLCSDGMAPYRPYPGSGFYGYGGSYGGAGGVSYQQSVFQLPSSFSPSPLFPLDDWDQAFGRHGGPMGGLGGGRVLIETSMVDGSVHLNSTISSNGAESSAEKSLGQGGAGTGGAVVIIGNEVIIGGSAVILAIGGLPVSLELRTYNSTDNHIDNQFQHQEVSENMNKYEEKDKEFFNSVVNGGYFTGGGGGGRLCVLSRSYINHGAVLDVSGGFDNSIDPSGFYSGGAGTMLFLDLPTAGVVSPAQGVLKIDNHGHETLAGTFLSLKKEKRESYFVSIDASFGVMGNSTYQPGMFIRSIEVINSGALCGNLLEFGHSASDTLTISTSSSLFSDIYGNKKSKDILLSVPSISLTQDSIIIISSGKIVATKSFKVDQTSSISFKGDLVIETGFMSLYGIVHPQTTITGSPVPSSLYLYAVNFSSFPSSRTSSGLIAIQGAVLSLGGFIDTGAASSCGVSSMEVKCSHWKEDITRAPVDTILMMADEITVLPSATVTAPFIEVCATELTVEGSFDTRGRGCTAMDGLGAGQSGDSASGGGGGGHAGNGGDGLTDQGGKGGGKYDLSLLDIDENTPIETIVGSTGSGGGTSSGGAGGGVIRIRVDNLILGSILRVGGSTGSYHGGGGSAGTMIISVQKSLAVAQSTFPVGFEATGGPSGNHGGGGGGGYLIFLFSSHDIIASSQDFLADITGGFSRRLKNYGGYGKAITVIKGGCPPGYGGLFCHPCPAGSYQSGYDAGICESCEEGKVSGPASPKCYACPMGYFMNNTVSNEYDYSEGYSSTYKPTQDFVDKYNMVDDAFGSDEIAMNKQRSHWNSQIDNLKYRSEVTQEMGSGDSSGGGGLKPPYDQCYKCPVGQFTRNTGSTKCEICQNKPEHSFYILGCEFQCEPGYIGSRCKSPFFEYMNLYGRIMILSILFGLGSALVVRLFRMRSRRKMQLKQQQEDEEDGGGRMVNNTLQYRNTKENPLSLHESDLPHHISRIYWRGKNTTKDPWYIPHECPIPTDLLVNSSFTDFAKVCNDATSFSKTERCIMFLLKYLCHPLSANFTNYLKKRKATSVEEVVKLSKQEFLIGTKARLLRDCLRFNCSEDCTLAWLDILWKERELPPEELSIGQPRIPAVFVFAGSGGFFSQYRFESQDILVQALSGVKETSNFIHEHWMAFGVMLNNFLRCVRPVTSPTFAASCQKALALISYINNDSDLLGGLKISLCKFWMDEPLGTPSHMLEPCDAKLGLVITKADDVNNKHKNESRIVAKAMVDSPNDMKRKRKRANMSPMVKNTNKIRGYRPPPLSIGGSGAFENAFATFNATHGIHNNNSHKVTKNGNHHNNNNKHIAGGYKSPFFSGTTSPNPYDKDLSPHSTPLSTPPPEEEIIIEFDPTITHENLVATDKRTVTGRGRSSSRSFSTLTPHQPMPSPNHSHNSSSRLTDGFSFVMSTNPTDALIGCAYEEMECQGAVLLPKAEDRNSKSAQEISEFMGTLTEIRTVGDSAPFNSVFRSTLHVAREAFFCNQYCRPSVVHQRMLLVALLTLLTLDTLLLLFSGGEVLWVNTASQESFKPVVGFTFYVVLWSMFVGFLTNFVGLISLVSASTCLKRQYVVWNFCALITPISLLCLTITYKGVESSQSLAMFFPLILFFVKVLIGYSLNPYIAQIEQQKKGKNDN